MAQPAHAFTQRVREQNIDMRGLIKEVLERAGCNYEAAAKELGITRQALRYQMAKHNLIVERCVVEAQTGAVPE